METATAPPHKNRKSTLARIRRFLANDDHFSTNSNQILMKSHGSLHSQIYSVSVPISLTVRSLKNSKNSCKETQLAIQEDISGKVEITKPAKVGDAFGPTWSTHLFKAKIKIPPEWEGKQIHLRWNSGSEAMLSDKNGNILQGFVPKHRESHTISKQWKAREEGPDLQFYIEMACNGLFGALGEGFSIDPPNPDIKYELKMAEIAVFEPLLFKLYTDIEMLLGIAEELENTVQGYQALFTANEMINLIVSNDNEKASELASNYFSEGNGKKTPTLVAMGHCHIDTAWLWTYSETKRKCARSWASQIQLMKEYPKIVFTCSQMQQLQWMKEEYPGLFEEIKEFVKQGRFLPVGGTWVEMDGLIPDGESFIRQFFYGQKFMEKEFGMKAKEFWLPDTFGYSGQLPQIMGLFGIKRFLTQKLSWNRVNKFLHHNFRWEGIDGSEVLTHFPPGDSYEMNGWVKELLKSVNNSEDKGRTNVGAYLYGLGDGGGGPTMPIVERLMRAQNVDGLPKVVFEGPDYFFTKLKSDSKNLCKWAGELYLEMHNGTYTSQAQIKWYNRKLERMLKDAEFCSTLLKLEGKNVDRSYLEMLEECWKGLLLNQFHDVIPGSCIEAVAKDAIEIYQNIEEKLKKEMVSSQQCLDGNGDMIVALNPLPWTVESVNILKLANGTESSTSLVFSSDVVQQLPDGEDSEIASYFKLYPSGFTKIVPIHPKDVPNPVKFSSNNGSHGTFSNGLIRLEVSLDGRSKEELFHKDGNGVEWEVFKDLKCSGVEPAMFYIYDDNPACWDAWDCDNYHLETRQDIITYNDGELGKLKVTAEGPLVGIYEWRTTAKSSKTGKPLNIIRQTIMKANSPLLEYSVKVEWEGQSHKFLKVEFPINVLSREATYEIQYGHIKRPTHENTSWDTAQYEVSGHKWIDLSQSDRGVSLLNDSKYGFRVKENVMSLSLLRAPKAPDANSDMHSHTIKYGILPHVGTFQQAGTIRKAYEFNCGTPWIKTQEKSVKLFNHVITTSDEAIIPEVVKLGYDKPDSTLCLRLYESFGGSSSNVEIKVRHPIESVVECDGMEEPTASNEKDYPIKVTEENANTMKGESFDAPTKFYSFRADFRPFEIKSFLVTLLMR